MIACLTVYHRVLHLSNAKPTNILLKFRNKEDLFPALMNDAEDNCLIISHDTMVCSYHGI